MKRGTFLATIALLIAIAGAIVAFAAYFKHRTCTLCDDYDEDFMDDGLEDLDYYATQVEEEDFPEAEEEPAAPQATASEQTEEPKETTES